MGTTLYISFDREIPVARGRWSNGMWQDDDRTDDLIDELKNAEEVLTAPARHGARFRFHIGF